jgi:hypothetical protein
VKSYQKISDTEGGFAGTLDDVDRFGFSVAPLGDLDGDGVGELAVGAPHDDDGGTTSTILDLDFGRGAVWILFLEADGRVKSHQKISSTQGGFAGPLAEGEWFGTALASLGDLDGDAVEDLAVGAYASDDGGPNRGALWILFLRTDGTVKSHQKISSTQGGLAGPLGDNDWFATSVTSLGDLDGDGVSDVAVGQPGGDDGGPNRGALWLLFLDTDGTVRCHEKLSSTQGDFLGVLDDGDQFGSGVASLGGLPGGSVGDLAVGAFLDDDGETPDRGAAWILFVPEPNPALLFAVAIGGLIVLRRRRHASAR